MFVSLSGPTLHCDDDEDHDDRDHSGKDLIRAEPQARCDGDEEVGELFGFLDGRPESDDRECAHEAQRQGERGFDDGDDEDRGENAPGKDLRALRSVRPRRAETLEVPAQQEGQPNPDREADQQRRDRKGRGRSQVQSHDIH